MKRTKKVKVVIVQENKDTGKKYRYTNFYQFKKHLVDNGGTELWADAVVHLIKQHKGLETGSNIYRYHPNGAPVPQKEFQREHKQEPTPPKPKRTTQTKRTNNPLF